jgi:hypothetical protein
VRARACAQPKDGYGIAPNQAAGNIFFKYGMNLHLHVGVSLHNVSWHIRR